MAAAAVATAGWRGVAVRFEHGGNEWVRARRGPLVLTVAVSGTLKAVSSEPVGPPQLSDYWSFKLAFMQPEGSDVRAGQPVLGFDTSELERQLEKKEAEADQARQEAEKRRAELVLSAEDGRLQLAEAAAALRRADLKLKVPAELQAAKEMETTALERDDAARELAYLKVKAEDERHAAEAEIAKDAEIERRAAARVAEIRSAIERMTVRAPRAGTVIYVADWRDEKRKVGDTVWRRDTVLEIPDLSRMMGVGQVEEADAGRVAVGQRVTLRLDAHPDVTFTGRLAGITQAMERKNRASQEKVVRVELEFDATDRARMRPGMRFAGKVEVETIADAVLLPVESVVVTPAGPVAMRRALFGPRTVPLRLGARNEELVQVLDGVREGDAVTRAPRSGATP